MVFLFAVFPLFSQETAPPPGSAPPVEGDESTLYVIAGYTYTVKGRSLPSALLYKLIDNGEYREGEFITGKANLEKYISDITQIYINQLVHVNLGNIA